MDIIFLLIAVPLALLAAYLIGDFLSWRAQGRLAFAVITELQGRKNKGAPLPVVTFEDADRKERTAKAARIDSFSYLFGKFEEGDTILLIYKESDPAKARVYGYINIVAGMFLLAPLFIALAGWEGNMMAAGQVFYFLAFGVIMLGAWFLMKLVQKNY